MEPLSSSLVSLAENAANLAIPEAIRKYMEKRRQQAFDILCEELRTAEIDTEEAALRDDMAAMLVKFFQATAQGAAFRNLKVLAKILAGKAADPSKGSDDFIMWADAIGGMLSEEVVFLATLIRHYEVQQQVAKPDEAPNLNEAMKNARNELRGKDKFFPDTPTYDGVGSALLRTGFVVPVSAWGGVAFAPSPRAMQLARMVRLDEWANSNL